MAKVSDQLTARVRASTILEVVVAMVVMVMVMGIAFMIFSNVTRLSLSNKKLKADAVLQEEMIKAEKSYNEDSSVQIESWKVGKKVKQYSAGLILIDLTLYDESNTVIGEMKRLIRSESK